MILLTNRHLFIINFDENIKDHIMKTRTVLSKFFMITSVAQVAFYSYILTKKVKKEGKKKVVKELKNKIKNLPRSL